MMLLNKKIYCPECGTKIETCSQNQSTGRFNLVCPECGKLIDASEDELKAYAHTGKLPSR